MKPKFPDPEPQKHTRSVGLRAQKVGFSVVYREYLPDGRVLEEESAPMSGMTALLSLLKRTLALRLMHSRAWKTWKKP